MPVGNQQGVQKGSAGGGGFFFWHSGYFAPDFSCAISLLAHQPHAARSLGSISLDLVVHKWGTFFCLIYTTKRKGFRDLVSYFS